MSRNRRWKLKTRKKIKHIVRTKPEKFLSREEVVAALRRDPSGAALVTLLRKYGFAPRRTRVHQMDEFIPLPQLF